MYLRKEIKDFIEKMPKEMKLPSHWRKFVNENSIKYNLIIKHGNEYECTNCGKHFYMNEKETFNFNAYAGQREFCPFCNNNYLIKNGNLKNWYYVYDLAVIDNIDNKIVMRYFDIRRDYDYINRKFCTSYVEYARIVPELNLKLVNERYHKYYMYGSVVEGVWHTDKIKSCRVFNGHLEQYYKQIYLENMETIMKNTIYEHAPLKEAIEYLNNDKVNFIELLEKAKYHSFELLMKAGLYNLAIEKPESFEIDGSFEKRFGVSKDFYDFMKKNNITNKELEVLRMIQTKDIRVIRRLLKLCNNYTTELVKVNNYINLLEFDRYAGEQKNFSIYNYLDYIRNMKRLDVPLRKKILMPENLTEAHDESVKKIKVVSSKKVNNKMKQRYKELKKNIYFDEKFIIRPAKDIKDMKDEAKQQNNCVYTNYSEDYAYGDTDIYFLRDIKQQDKSLVTVEVLGNRIRQKRQSRNTAVTPEQNAFLNLWEKQVLKAA